MKKVRLCLPALLWGALCFSVFAQEVFQSAPVESLSGRNPAAAAENGTFAEFSLAALAQKLPALDPAVEHRLRLNEVLSEDFFASLRALLKEYGELKLYLDLSQAEVLPEAVVLPEKAFAGCSALVSLTIPEGITEIGSRAFAVCTSLESIVLPESLRIIGEDAFYRCESLQEMNLPSRLEKLESGAFYDCGSLTRIVIPGTVTELGRGVFYGCYELAGIYVADFTEKPAGWNPHWNIANRSRVYWGQNGTDSSSEAAAAPQPAAVNAASLAAVWNKRAVYAGYTADFTVRLTADDFKPPIAVQFIDWHNNDFIAFESELTFKDGIAVLTLDTSELRGLSYELLDAHDGSYEFMLCPRLVFADGTALECKDARLLVAYYPYYL